MTTENEDPDDTAEPAPDPAGVKQLDRIEKTVGDIAKGIKKGGKQEETPPAPVPSKSPTAEPTVDDDESSELDEFFGFNK